MRLILYCAILVIVWGSAFTFIGHAVQYVSPAYLVASRTIVGSIFLTIFMYWRGHRFPKLTDPLWLWFALLGLIGMAAPFLFTAKGQVHVDSGLTSILIGFMPLVTIVLAHFFIKGEQLSLRKLLGFIVGFIGIVILFMPDTLSFELIKDWHAQSLILIAAVLYAFTTVIIKRAPAVQASVGAAMLVICSAIWSILWLICTDMPTSLPPQPAIWSLIALGIGSTGFAQITYIRVIQMSGPTLIAKINYVVPIFALICGITFLNEPFNPRAVLALCIVFLGLLIARSSKAKN